MTPRERADRAQAILNDQVFQEMFADIREKLISKLEKTAAEDVTMQHEITLSLQNLQRLRAQLLVYTQEIVIDNANQRHESWIRRMKQTLAP